MDTLDSTTFKICSKCGQLLPATTEFFFRHNQKRDGLRPDCKACNYKQSTEWRHKNSDHIREYDRAWYHKNKDSYAAYRNEHREERSAYLREYAAVHSDEAVKRANQWRVDNPERSKMLQRVARQKRHTRMRDAEGTFGVSDIAALYEEQNGLCGYCGIRFHNDFEIDHIIPIVRGGTNWPDNLLLACPSCNAQKNARTPEEWMAIRGW